MKLLIHYPHTRENQKELGRRVAVLHAEAVIDYINGLPCSYEDKMNLFKLIQTSYFQDGRIALSSPQQ